MEENKNHRRFKCESCQNIFISKAKIGTNLRCRNGEKKGCGSTLVSFIEKVTLNQENIKDINESIFNKSNEEVGEKIEEEKYFKCSECGFDKIKKNIKHCLNCGTELNWNFENKENSLW